MNIQEKISQQVKTDAIVLYMKGIPQAPQCGFSAATVQLLQDSGAKDFTAIDVLSDPEIRAGIKTYSSWPTVPQLFVGGEFVGGADIVREMHEQGELQKLVTSVMA